MNNKAIIKGFLFPTFLQITVVTVIAGILKEEGYELGYNSLFGILLIIFFIPENVKSSRLLVYKL